MPRSRGPGRARRRRWRGAALNVVGSVVLAGAMLGGRVLWPDAPAVAGPVLVHPQDDWAGSQIIKHEGVGSYAQQGAGVGAGTLPGLDVSSYQGTVNWPAVAGGGATFAYVKATESTTYTSPTFSAQYNGAKAAGLIPGAYHFAIPNASSGAAQADYFLAHGGGLGGLSLPPAVDLEYNPYGDTCYGMSAPALVSWVRDFTTEVDRKTGRYPTIYTSTSWWSQCTGNDPGFGATDPLWIPRYGSSVGSLPAGWNYHTFWQFADAGQFPGDQDYFNGALGQLRLLAGG
ncbi:MAG TPA: GH25 family lysozyme [Pseudonocardiaceae bacterium]